jgi:polysaccharide pyruvyl transferase WcaK-like protein
MRVAASIRVGLLTPYGGTNLGDGAIQTAIIEGIRRYLPEADLCGITLNPSETKKRHGIPCFPLTGLLVSFYSESLFAPVEGLRIRFSGNSSNSEASTPTGFVEPSGIPRRDVIWASLKAVPLIGGVLKLVIKCLRSSLVVVHELRHIRTSLQFVRTLDMVIVAGGGQLDEEWGGPWGHPYVLLRWAILTRIAGKKFVVVSVGAGKLKTRLGRLFIKKALALASYRSYRDLVSKAMLQEWRFTKNDPCVPDLAFGVRIKVNETTHSSSERLTVGISPIAFGHKDKWPTTATDVYAAYLSSLTEFMAKLDSMGYQMILFTSSGSDRQVVTELREKVSREFSNALRDKIRVPRVETVDQFFTEVGKVDIVVASRLHGTILSHMLEKPVVAISFDPKVDTHMRNMSQGAYLLDIRHFNAIDLMERFKLLSTDAANIKKVIHARLHDFHEPLENQYQQLATLIRSR